MQILDLLRFMIAERQCLRFAGLNLHPLSSCWDSEESLDDNDIRKLLATCWEARLLDNKLHVLILYTAKGLAVPPDVLPSNHKVHYLEESTSSADRLFMLDLLFKDVTSDNYLETLHCRDEHIFVAGTFLRQYQWHC